MNYLVDTDWVINFLKGREETVEVLRSLFGDGLAISLITYGEIHEGIYGSSYPDRHELSFQRFLHGVEVLPLNPAIMRQFASIRLDLRSEGQLIGDSDILIAATAIHHGLILLTNNARYFKRIDKLQLNRFA